MIEGNSSINWEKQVRFWSISAWSFLTLGITLGSWWAYYELGWGGYWFWDPVENVALMPWLAATAFIHSLSASSKSSILRIWTILLSILVFSLSLFGAFIVRSGIIDSVHSFANDPERGLYLLAFIGILVMTSLILFSYRFTILISNKRIVSLSKESFISINNIFFGTLIFSTMLGVMYPLIYEFIYDQKISVGAPFYNAIFVPITLLACLFLIFSIESKWQSKLKFAFLNNPLIISFVFSLFIIPYLITVVSTLLMYLAYHKDRFRNQRRENDVEMNTLTSNENTTVAMNPELQRQQRNIHKKFVKMITLIFIGYSITCLPNLIAIILILMKKVLLSSNFQNALTSFLQLPIYLLRLPEVPRLPTLSCPYVPT